MNGLLENKKIILTRPLSNDDQSLALFKKEGCSVLNLPMISIESNSLSFEEKNLLLNIDRFDWLIFTSKNGVRYFFDHWQSVSGGKSLPKRIKTAAVGHSTGMVLEEFGLEVDFVSTGKTSADMLEQMRAVIAGKEKPRLLLLLGNLAGNTLEQGLGEIASPVRLNVYNTLPSKDVDEEIIQYIKDDNYDLILISSPSAFNNLKDILHPFPVQQLRIACIGPTTEMAIKNSGVDPVLVAKISTALGLYESVKNYFELTYNN